MLARSLRSLNSARGGLSSWRVLKLWRAQSSWQGPSNDGEDEKAVDLDSGGGGARSVRDRGEGDDALCTTARTQMEESCGGDAVRERRRQRLRFGLGFGGRE